MLYFNYIDWTLEEIPRPIYCGLGNEARVHYLKRNKYHTNVSQKYGFKREIVLVTSVKQVMIDNEISLIAFHHTFVDDPLWNGIGTNLTSGGEYFHHSNETKKRLRLTSHLARGADLTLRNRSSERRHQLSIRMKQEWHEGIRKRPDWNGRTHREETKRKIGDANSVAQRGMKNSQFGTVWISNIDERCSRRVLKDDLQNWLSKGWKLGRKMNWL